MMSKKLTKQIEVLEKEFEQQKELEIKKFWERVYSMADILHQTIKDEYGVDPKQYFFDDEYNCDMPTTYRSALQIISKTILDLSTSTKIEGEGK